MFSTPERDELLNGLDFNLQPGWGPQRPAFHTGLDMLRYNRVEGFSAGASLASVLGLGYTALGIAHFGTGDREFNGELSLSRSNGRSDLRVTAFRRLAVANDEWGGGGSPLSFGASLANVLYGREKQNHPLALEVRECNTTASIVQCREIGCFISSFYMTIYITHRICPLQAFCELFWLTDAHRLHWRIAPRWIMHGMVSDPSIRAKARTL